MLRSNCIRLCLLGLLTASLPSCNILFPRADPTQYYVLREFPANAAPSKLASNSGLEVLVGPAAIPGYLDRNTGGIQVKFHNGLEYRYPTLC